jgi:hypothetical protein
MSPIGYFLLANCSEDFRFDLNDLTVIRVMEKLGFKKAMVRLAALHLGVTLEGGS